MLPEQNDCNFWNKKLEISDLPSSYFKYNAIHHCLKCFCFSD